MLRSAGPARRGPARPGARSLDTKRSTAAQLSPHCRVSSVGRSPEPAAPLGRLGIGRPLFRHVLPVTCPRRHHHRCRSVVAVIVRIRRVRHLSLPCQLGARTERARMRRSVASSLFQFNASSGLPVTSAATPHERTARSGSDRYSARCRPERSPASTWLGRIRRRFPEPTRPSFRFQNDRHPVVDLRAQLVWRRRDDREAAHPLARWDHQISHGPARAIRRRSASANRMRLRSGRFHSESLPLMLAGEWQAASLYPIERPYRKN